MPNHANFEELIQYCITAKRQNDKEYSDDLTSNLMMGEMRAKKYVWGQLVSDDVEDIMIGLDQLLQMEQIGWKVDSLRHIFVSKACDWIECTNDFFGYQRFNPSCVAETDANWTKQLLNHIKQLAITDDELNGRINKLVDRYILNKPPSPPPPPRALQRNTKIDEILRMDLKIQNDDVKSKISSLKDTYRLRTPETFPKLVEPEESKDAKMSLLINPVQDIEKLNPIYSNTVKNRGRDFNTTVWKGRIKKNGVEVAIKTYKSTDRELVECYKTEVAILEKFDGLDPCFLDYYGSYFEETLEGSDLNYTLYIIMELCDLTLMDDLNIRAKNKQPYDIETITYLCFWLLKGFMILEKSKVYHQDIRPQNIFISRSGLLKIAEFNGAVTDDVERNCMTTWTYPVQGNNNYLAPELQAALDHRKSGRNSIKMKFRRGKADCYSLGLTILQVLTSNSIDGVNKMDQIQIDRFLERIGPPWIKNMLSLMLKVNPRERGNFRRVIRLIPLRETDGFK